MFSALRSRVCTSPVARSCVRRMSGHDDHGGGVPGSNLPFDINNRYKLTLYFTLYFGSGLAIPFFMLKHQLTKGL